MSIVKPGQTDNKNRITIPCGSCPACLNRNRNEWSFRLNQEWKYSKTSHFVTLTYDDLHTPIMGNEDTGEFSQSLDGSDLTLFLKRLRQFHKRGYSGITEQEIILLAETQALPLRYYAIGEYGTKTHRPHYHLLIFNLGKLALTLIQKAWQTEKQSIGHSYLGSCNERSINYVTSYMITKKQHPPNSAKPFTVMSRNPGIGARYLNSMKDWHSEESRFFSILPGGTKVNLPRYYRDRIFSDLEKERHQFETLPEIRKKQDQHEVELRERGENVGQYTLEQHFQYTEKMRNSINKNQKL